MKRKLVALTVVAASVTSMVALRRRGMLPRVQVDTAKAKEAVKISRTPNGRHEKLDNVSDLS